MKSAVVVEVGDDVEAVTGSKIPRLASDDLVVNEDIAYKGAKWSSVVAMGAVEVLTGLYGRIQCGLA